MGMTVPIAREGGPSGEGVRRWKPHRARTPRVFACGVRGCVWQEVRDGVLGTPSVCAAWTC